MREKSGPTLVSYESFACPPIARFPGTTWKPGTFWRRQQPIFWETVPSQDQITGFLAKGISNPAYERQTKMGRKASPPTIRNEAALLGFPNGQNPFARRAGAGSGGATVA
jgi:hypothetical protein